MYLKALEIQGFKSFPDKTVLNFGNDITAIVGPNGSGKSNLSDAIRWVMGEQSSKALRGGKMEDVIFGGTQKRPQLGFAEASLVFDNSDGIFAMEASEIMVTRRYYRSGESEYYINKQSARLRDINELFMDTGLGREGYSNISQGRIDEILSVKSTDRREVFEEAAGISKYRHRKEETERRLANTQDNLLRVGDKISELELQVEPLREQAEKAKKFLAYRDELRGLEVAVWLDTLEKLSQTARKAEADYNSAMFILHQEHEALNQLYVSAEGFSFELHAKDLETDSLRETISAMEGECRQLDGQIAVLQGNVDNNLENIRRVQAELADQEDRRGSISEQIARQEARVAEIDTQITALQQQLDAALQQSKQLTDSAEGMNRQFLQLRNRQSALQSDLAARTADAAAVQDTLSVTRQRLDSAKHDADSAAQRRADAQKQLEQTAKARQRAQERVQSYQNTIAGYQLRAKARLEKKEELQKQLNTLSVQLDTTASRARMFREMEKEYEGYSKAVRFLMQEQERGRLQNIHGPVSALIKTEDDYTVAVEIALGSAMQQLVVTAEQDAKYAINLLKTRDCGRATFLPMSTIRPKPLQERDVEQCRGFVGIAADLVSCKPEYAAIISNLLGRTVIAENMDLAIAMARQYHHRFRIVTLDGQVINAGGSMTGGSVSKNTGILSRANELKRLTDRETALTQQLQQAKSAFADAARSAQQVEYECATAGNQLRQAEDEVLRLQGEEKQYTVLLTAIEDAIRSSDRENETLKAQQKNDSEREIKLQAQIELLKSQLAQVDAEVAQLSDGQSAATEQTARVTETITSVKMDIAALEAEKSASTAAIANLRELAAAMQGDRAQRQALINQYSQENEETNRKIAVVCMQRDAQNAQTAQTREELKQALADRVALEAKKTKTEKDAQQKSKDILNMERESARLENKKTTAELEEKQIIDKLWDSYQLTRSTATSERAEIESISQANKAIATLKRKIGALGSPNLGAIEEFARVNERYQYLTGQRDDILTAKRELEAIVRDITTQMTEIFVREFAKINEYFSQTFVEMFGGGKGALILEDPNDPLGCGIEIRVQPPGKQLKTITLLSGGEKAFVAIALYFAILKVRPTPFCMLDEIDAALDDRNVQRFASYLRRLCQKTQFIVITHRRGTMEEADILYGVTMQEQGVSKILHMDLAQMEHQLGIK